jgi:hypothetical protein
MATQSGTNNTDVKNWVPCGAGFGLPPASAGAPAMLYRAATAGSDLFESSAERSR